MHIRKKINQDSKFQLKLSRPSSFILILIIFMMELEFHEYWMIWFDGVLCLHTKLENN